MAKGHFKWNHSTETITYNSWRSMRNRCLFITTSALFVIILSPVSGVKKVSYVTTATTERYVGLENTLQI